MLIPRSLLSLAQTTTPSHFGITEKITQWAVSFINSAGYLGAAILMALESMIAPIPSEAVMPFVGMSIADPNATYRMTLLPAILATSAGSLLGSLISYYLGYFGGKPLVMKVGRFLLINEHHLDWTISFFHKRSGTWTVFICRFIPVVRHFISIPAGIGKMPLLPFCIATVIGATMWNGALLAFGYYWGSHLEELKKYYKMLDVAVILLGIAAVALWFYLHLKKPAKRPVPTDAP